MEPREIVTLSKEQETLRKKKKLSEVENRRLADITERLEAERKLWAAKIMRQVFGDD